MNEAALKQLEKVKAEMDTLEAILEDDDEDKRKISMLVSGTPDLHIRNPELFKQMKPYADPQKPPFTTQLWQLVVMGMGDVRPTYDALERMERGEGE